MAVVRSFRALRYTTRAGSLADLVAPPYDVIDARERARLAALGEANVIHLILPEGDEPYRTAAVRLARWRERGWLATEEQPAMFLYAQRFADRGRSVERWGVLVALELQPFSARVVLPHERTLAAPKADRLNLIRACRTNLSPIFGLVDTSLDLASLAAHAEPMAAFEDRAGVGQRLWRISDPEVAALLAKRIGPEQVFIADGHHRYEISLAYRDERRKEAPEALASRSFDFVLAYLCSTRDPGLVVQPTHRLLAQAPPDELPGAWARRCRVTAFDDPRKLATAIATDTGHTEGQASIDRRPRVGVVLRGSPRSWLLETDDASADRLSALPVELRGLDVSFLHEVVLPGIGADRFEYTHDDAEALAAVARGEAALAVLLPPPQVDDVLRISRASLTMPQKSTYFHPKVLTGLVFHALD
ncbi:MAG TPA: DUF1015 domain-containing protein [Candidatus Bathyarchaeia archaeon]|nr:DUF1015 domain-containing protein [Candidatus Bathyarchaeia archaeon]